MENNYIHERKKLAEIRKDCPIIICVKPDGNCATCKILNNYKGDIK